MAGQKAHRLRPDNAAYQKERRRSLHYLYFSSEEELARLRKMAESDGYAHDLNGWILLKLYSGLSGSVFQPEYVEGLREEAKRLRSYLDAARGENEEHRKELRILRERQDALLGLLQETPEGQELAEGLRRQERKLALARGAGEGASA